MTRRHPSRKRRSRKQMGGVSCRTLFTKKLLDGYKQLNFFEKVGYQSCKHVLSRGLYKTAKGIRRVRNIKDYEKVFSSVPKEPSPKSKRVDRSYNLQSDAALKFFRHLPRQKQEYFAKELAGMDGYDKQDILDAIRSSR